MLPRRASITALLKKYGMHHIPAALESIVFDPCSQIPPMIDHLELLSMVGKLVRLTHLDLTTAGRGIFNAALQKQPLPPHWATDHSASLLGPF